MGEEYYNEQTIMGILADIKMQLEAQAQWMTSNVVDKTSVGGNTININVEKEQEQDCQEQWGHQAKRLKKEIYHYLVESEFIEEKYLEEFKDFLIHLH